jgi:hypothetical protein
VLLGMWVRRDNGPRREGHVLSRASGRHGDVRRAPGSYRGSGRSGSHDAQPCSAHLAQTLAQELAQPA